MSTSSTWGTPHASLRALPLIARLTRTRKKNARRGGGQMDGEGGRQETRRGGKILKRGQLQREDGLRRRKIEKDV